MHRQEKRSRIARRTVVHALLLGLLLIPSGAASSGSEVDSVAMTEGMPVPGETTLSEAVAVAGSVDVEWWSTVQDDLLRSEYHVTWGEGTYLEDVPAAFQAPNRAENLRTYFVPAGPILIPRQGIEPGEPLPWRWETRLMAWGREGAMVAVSEATFNAQANHIVYLRDGNTSAMETWSRDTTTTRTDWSRALSFSKRLPAPSPCTWSWRSVAT